MEKQKIYLETTMFSYYHEERPQAEYQELKTQVRRIFNRINAGEYEPYTSVLSTTEIDAEPNTEKREKMRLFQNFSFGTATLDLREKAGFRPLFPRACGKTIGFWNRLK